MIDRMTLQDCIRLAEFAHFNQTDHSGAGYIDHPKRVLASVQAQGAAPYVQMAAVLHDVTEDTPFTPDMLLAFGVPAAAVDIVRLVDRDISEAKYRESADDPTKEDIDLFYYEQIRNHPGALQVKLADIGDNTQPWRLVYLNSKLQTKLRSKYANATRLLTEDDESDR